MGCEPDLLCGRPCDLPGCAESTNPSLSFCPPGLPPIATTREATCVSSRWICIATSARSRSKTSPGARWRVVSSHRTESSDSREEDCAFERPTLTRRKLRGLELKAEDGRRSWPSGHALSTKQDRAREAEFAEQVETAYRRLVADWQPKPKSGAGATRGTHFQVIFLAKRQQRGREQPQNLRFSSSSPAPETTLPQRRKFVQTP